MNKSWHQKSIIYSVDIESFYDENDDGTGDIQGLISKLGYIAGLGINCIWLLPFFPSPNHDNGYDVMDYYDVDSRFGTLGDFAELVQKAGQYGIRIIIDLVVNHTSNKHPWFLEARKNRLSMYRDYYVWSDKPVNYNDKHLILSGEENTIWTYDKAAGQFYLHRFYKEQPDLNIANPNVRNEIMKIMGFWLQIGVSGFRIDAAEILIESYGIKGQKKAVEGILDEMRAYIEARKSDAILIAEANIKPDKIATYMNHGRRMHSLFNFYINQHLFLSLAKGTATDLTSALKRMPTESNNQWLQFLRHHDELSLKLLTDTQRKQVFSRFAPEAAMQIYGKGIRRRLAPMLNWDYKMMRLAFSLMFSLPGIPLLRYGDEIGMGDDLSLPGRESVRTPMQWADMPNGGFSRAPAKKLGHPAISGSKGYQYTNVIAAQNIPTSFINWMKLLISTRKQCQEIIEQPASIIRTRHRNILVHTYKDSKHQLLLLHNLSDKPANLQKNELGITGIRLFSMLTDDSADGHHEEIPMNAYGFRWLKIFL